MSVLERKKQNHLEFDDTNNLKCFIEQPVFVESHVVSLLIILVLIKFNF